MINIAVPNNAPDEIKQLLQEILRRSIDGTVVPLFTDTTNQRVLVGSASASATPAKMEVNGGDLKIIGGGNGLIIPTRDGTKYYRIVMENDGTPGFDGPYSL